MSWLTGRKFDQASPDIVRTLGNVANDVAATATAAKRTGFTEAEAESEQDRILEERA